MTDIINKLADVLESRKGQRPDSSYVAGLYDKGTNTILKKIGEEASEVIIAAKDQDKQAIIHEIADLWFHTMILLSSLDLKPDQVFDELERRFGESGLKEKANRTE